MRFKKVMAGVVGILFVACLAQALFIFHFRDFDQFSRYAQRPADGAGQPTGSARSFEMEKTASSREDAFGTSSKLELKQEAPSSLPTLGSSSADTNPTAPEAFRLPVHDPLLASSQPPPAAAFAQKPDVPVLLTKSTLLETPPPLGVALSQPEKGLAPFPQKDSPLPPLSASKASEFPSPPAAKSSANLPMAIPFPAAGATDGSSAEPPLFAGKPTQPTGPDAPSFPSLSPFAPPAKPEDPAATLARVHKEMAELMSPEELQKAVAAATAQLGERKKRKEKERKEQAAHAALEKTKTALKQISSEYPDTEAGKKAAQFLKSLENAFPAFPGLSPVNPTALELIPLVMALTR